MRKERQTEQYFKKVITNRSWPEIKSLWIEDLSHLDSESDLGRNPPESIEEQYQLNGIIERLKDKDTNAENSYYEEIGGIREIIIRQAFYLLHKGLNILAAAESNVNRGQLTVSLIDSYHSSFQFAKSIIQFLGISLPHINKDYLLVDVWSLKNSNKKKGLSDFISAREVKVFFFKVKKVEQQNIWMILQRLIRALHKPPWNEDYNTIISNINTSDFGKTRNYLFYENTGWVFDDLHEYFSPNNDFGLIKNYKIQNYRELSKEYFNDFNVMFGCILLDILIKILEDLAESSNIVENELSFIENKIHENHPIYYYSIKAQSP